MRSLLLVLPKASSALDNEVIASSAYLDSILIVIIIQIKIPPKKGEEYLYLEIKSYSMYNIQLMFNPELGKLIRDSIIYQQDGLLAVNKPAGLATHGSSPNVGYPDGVREILVEETGRDYHPVHRLDKVTSGIVLFGADRGVRRSLFGQFCRREVGKIYLAIVDGRVLDESLENCTPIGFKDARTLFRVLAHLESDQGRPFTLVEARPLTGRTHQIRIHLSRMGYPITGDLYYEGSFAQRSMLHAWKLDCLKPGTKDPLTFIAKPPEDFSSFLKDLSHTPRVPGMTLSQITT